MMAGLWCEWKSVSYVLIMSIKYRELGEWARESPARVHIHVHVLMSLQRSSSDALFLAVLKGGVALGRSCQDGRWPNALRLPASLLLSGLFHPGTCVTSIAFAA